MTTNSITHQIKELYKELDRGNMHLVYDLEELLFTHGDILVSLLEEADEVLRTTNYGHPPVAKWVHKYRQFQSGDKIKI